MAEKSNVHPTCEGQSLNLKYTPKLTGVPIEAIRCEGHHRAHRNRERYSRKAAYAVSSSLLSTYERLRQLKRTVDSDSDCDTD